MPQLAFGHGRLGQPLAKQCKLLHFINNDYESFKKYVSIHCSNPSALPVLLHQIMQWGVYIFLLLHLVQVVFKQNHALS